MDENGGKYDEGGKYRTAEELEDIQCEEEYYDEQDDEEEVKDSDAYNERMAANDTNVVPAIQWAK